MNVLTYYQAMQNHVKGKNMEELFPAEFFANMPFVNVRQGHCLACSKPMTDEEMKPQGRITPRAMCPGCWAKATAYTSENCWVCEGKLDQDVVANQMKSQKDVHHRIHDHGECRNYFSVLSAHILGIDTGIITLNENQRISVSSTQLQLPVSQATDFLGGVVNRLGLAKPQSEPIGVIAKDCRR